MNLARLGLSLAITALTCHKVTAQQRRAPAQIVGHDPAAEQRWSASIRNTRLTRNCTNPQSDGHPTQTLEVFPWLAGETLRKMNPNINEQTHLQNCTEIIPPQNIIRDRDSLTVRGVRINCARDVADSLRGQGNYGVPVTLTFNNQRNDRGNPSDPNLVTGTLRISIDPASCNPYPDITNIY